MDGFEEPGEYVNIKTDTKEHEATGQHNEFHDACITYWCDFFLALIKEERFCNHTKCLYHDRDEYGKPVDISEDTQLMLGLLFREIHYMLVDQAAEHIIHHSSHTYNDKRVGIVHYF